MKNSSWEGEVPPEMRYGQASTLGDVLEALATQPVGDVWVEDSFGANHHPTDLLAKLEPRHLVLPIRVRCSGNHAPITFAGELTLIVHWSNKRQGFIPLLWNLSRSLHYFCPNEFWPISERWRIVGSKDTLTSLCQRTSIQNDQPIIYPELDDPMICRNCLRKIRASQP